MWTRAQLKANGKMAFTRNYWSCVVVCLLIGLLGGGAATNFTTQFNYDFKDGSFKWENVSPTAWLVFTSIFLIILVIATCYTILVGNLVRIGGARFFLENREHETSMGQIFFGFKNGRYTNNVLIMFLYNLYIFAWSLLLIIPGIIKSYEYLLVPYLLADNPQLDRKRVFKLSAQMMEGHKMEAFVFGLSFFGWIFLGIFTCGLLNTFYVNPYMEASWAEYYTAIKAEAFYKGITDENELPGFADIIV